MAEIKMDLDIVSEFYTFMDKIKGENVKLNEDLHTAKNNVVDSMYIAEGANQYDTFFMEIYRELSQKLATETDELIMLVKKEMEDFQKTGAHLGP